MKKTTARKELPKSIKEALEALRYRSEEEAIQDITLLELHSKVSEFTEECLKFEKKYKMSWKEFQKKVELESSRENFEEEEDLMAWKFSKEQKRFWQEKLRRVLDDLPSVAQAP